MVKTSGLEARGNRIGLEPLQSPILRELSLWVLSRGSLEDLTCKLFFSEPELEHHQPNSLFPEGVCQKQPEEHWGCLRQRIITAHEEQVKKLKKKIWGNEKSPGAFTQFWDTCGDLQSYTPESSGAAAQGYVHA